MRVTRQSLAAGEDNYEHRISPRGQDYFWNVWSPATEDAEGTDLHAFEAGYITITPLTIDQTDQEQLERMREYFEENK